MPVAGGDLANMRHRASAAFVDRAKKLNWLLKASKSILYAGMAAIAGVAQFMAVHGHVPPWGWAGIGATFIIFIFAVINIIVEPEAVKELGVAHQAIDAARHAQRDAEAVRSSIISYQEMFARMTDLFNSTKAMRGLIQNACVTSALDEDALVSTLVDMAGRSVAIGAGFAQSDEWTICVYKAHRVDDHHVLKLVEDMRAIPCSKAEARDWREGQGVAGIALAKADEIIIADLSADSVRSVTFLKADENRISNGRYRSMVAVPVFLPGQALPWGVVCGTNDKPNHFNHERGPRLKNEEAIRTLASYLGLAISVSRSKVGGMFGGAAATEQVP